MATNKLAAARRAAAATSASFARETSTKEVAKANRRLQRLAKLQEVLQRRQDQLMTLVRV